MADTEPGAAGGGICGLIIFSALSPWCNTKAFGSGDGAGGSHSGCCGWCCNKSFNEDSWDKVERKQREEAEAERAKAAKAGGDGAPATEQPRASKDMAIPAPTAAAKESE